MVMTAGNRGCNTTFMIKNETLEMVNSYKYLGMTISKNGHFKQAIVERANKAKRAIKKIRILNISKNIFTNP